MLLTSSVVCPKNSNLHQLPMAVMERARSRHCLEVVDCATDKMGDIRDQRANWSNKDSQSWVKGLGGGAVQPNNYSRKGAEDEIQCDRCLSTYH